MAIRAKGCLSKGASLPRAGFAKGQRCRLRDLWKRVNLIAEAFSGALQLVYQSIASDRRIGAIGSKRSLLHERMSEGIHA